MRRVSPSALMMVSLMGGVCACERAVTSVGSWEPPPTAGQSGGAGTAGGAGSGGASSAGTSADSGAGGEPDTLGGQYIEAELGELSGGFTVGVDASASNGQYLLAPDQAAAEDAESPATARYSFTVAEGGNYLIWGRIYAPDIDTNRFHVQVDGGTPYLWRITVGDIWYWDDVHDNFQYHQPLRFPLAAGTHELVIGNVAAGARLDRLYITAGGYEPPGNNTQCRPPHSIELGGVCHPSCGAQATPERATTCTCGGRPDAELFDAYDCASGSCCFAP